MVRQSYERYIGIGRKEFVLWVLVTEICRMEFL